jgi:hypothetical protein
VTLINTPFYTEWEKKFDLYFQKANVETLFPEIAKVFLFKEKLMVVDLQLEKKTYLNKYQVQILHCPNFFPVAYLKSPKIIPNETIHMNYDGTLCLFDPANIGYRHKFLIATEIIPWCIKWIHYYEVWMINGNHWLGKETPHGIRPRISGGSILHELRKYL